jgi:trigger factor
VTVEVEIKEQGAWKKQLSIVIPIESVQREMEGVVESYRRRAALPGFRKGKAPTEVIKGRFQQDLEADLLNRLIPDAFEEAVRQKELKPVPGSERFHEIRFAQGEPLRFLADLEVWPEIEVTAWKGLPVEQEIFDVDDRMVEEALEALRRSRATYTKVDRASEPGDGIRALLEPVDIHGKKIPSAAREEVRMEADGASLLPEFRAVSVGLRAGDVRPIEVAYPADFRDEKLAGKVRRFRLTAEEILEKKIPALDDQFAQSLDPGLDLEGLKSKVRLRLESEELMRSKQRLEDTLIDRILAAHPFPVPEALMRYSFEKLLERFRAGGEPGDEQALVEQYAPVIDRMHHRDILLQNVARQESLEVTEEEVEAEIDNLAQEAGVESAVLRRKMEGEGELTRMVDTLQERKVLDFLVANAQVNRVRRPRPEPGAPRSSRIITP